ncbi:5-hydroxytryptamine receptor 4 [Lynx canadensis]|nr:5-hydroxytryptamine receptor 4 [Lynx canadensis]
MPGFCSQRRLCGFGKCVNLSGPLSLPVTGGTRGWKKRKVTAVGTCERIVKGPCGHCSPTHPCVFPVMDELDANVRQPCEAHVTVIPIVQCMVTKEQSGTCSRSRNHIASTRPQIRSMNADDRDQLGISNVSTGMSLRGQKKVEGALTYQNSHCGVLESSPQLLLENSSLLFNGALPCSRAVKVQTFILSSSNAGRTKVIQPTSANKFQELKTIGPVCIRPAYFHKAYEAVIISVLDIKFVDYNSKEGFGSVEKVVLLTFLSAVILMAILGNLLVMVAVCRDRQLRKIKTNYFIVSLAFADLLVSVLVMPFGAIELVQDIWIYGEMFCLVRTSLDVLLTTASIFHLCCISLDRYYAICCQPLVYRNKMTPLRIALMLGGCWVIPTFISFLPIMQGWNNIGIIDLERISKPRLGQDLHVIEKRKFNQNSNSTYCIFMVNKPYAITCSVVAFYIPFLLMVLAYYRIYVTAKEHAHQIQMLQRAGAPSEGRPQPADQHSTHRMRTETKAAKTLCIIMGCFCLCWAPFFVTNIVDPFIDYTVPGQVWTAFLWLGYINSGLNPFLYAFLNKSFRRAFLIILCCDDERYRRPSILGQAVPCSTTTINGSTHVLRDAVECGGQWESHCHPPATSSLVAAQPSDT